MTTASERNNASLAFPTSAVLSPRLRELCHQLRRALAGVCAPLLLMGIPLLLVGALAAQAQTQSVTFAGVQTTVPASGLSGPFGLAVDAAGDIFIADPNNNRVVEVPAGGGTQTTIGFGLNTPEYVAVDRAGDVYISDSFNNRVVKVPAGCTQAPARLRWDSDCRLPTGATTSEA